MNVFRRALHHVADTPVGDRLRTYMKYRSPVNIRPMRSNASVSDLFPWRIDETWETRFDLTNTPSFLFPKESLTDQVTLVAFRANGREINRIELLLSPFETRPYRLVDLVGSGNGQIGTFAVFHHSAHAEKMLAKTKTHMAERGYLSFKRKTDSLWAVVHGNLHCVSKSPSRPDIDITHGRVAKPVPYRLQLDMSDCRSFELSFTNPSTIPQPLEIVYLSGTRSELRREKRIIKPRGIELFHWNNDEQLCTLCEAWGAMPMWRPAIFKHYDSHFNVLHS